MDVYGNFTELFTDKNERTPSILFRSFDHWRKRKHKKENP